MYASEWIFGLFASVIPLEEMSHFFDHFFVSRWIFFYQLILCILKFNQRQLLNEEDIYQILSNIKCHSAASMSNGNKQKE